jgi:hypothetical protein
MTTQDTARDDRRWMSMAVDLPEQCPPSEGAYSVGAAILDGNGQEISRAYSRVDTPPVHALELAGVGSTAHAE